jgi:hypothetical protein
VAVEHGGDSAGRLAGIVDIVAQQGVIKADAALH